MTKEEEEVPVHPVQRPMRHNPERATCPQVVTLKAYEVYAHIHGKQEAMITGFCRGGFSTGELIAFLYAHNFPQNEWKMRANEAFNGMKGL